MGGGGDGGYQDRQDAIDRDKASARARLNELFGVGDTQAAQANKTAADGLYSKVRSDAFTAGKARVDDQKAKAGRDLKFELFAKGLNGGSVDVDQNALLGRTYSQGLTDLGAKADATAADLRGNDTAARLQLLQSIDNGMDQGSAVSSALGQLKVNSDKAAADATGSNIGDLFANAGLLYQKSQASQGRAAANAWWRQNGGAYLPRGTSGNLSNTG